MFYVEREEMDQPFSAAKKENQPQASTTFSQEPSNQSKHIIPDYDIHTVTKIPYYVQKPLITFSKQIAELVMKCKQETSYLVFERCFPCERSIKTTKKGPSGSRPLPCV